MDIELKSNRDIQVACILVPTILVSALFTFMVIAVCLDLWGARNELIALIIISVAEVILICAVLFIKFFNRKHYTFTDDSISIYSKKYGSETILIDDIQVIDYKKFKFSFSSLFYVLMFQDTPYEQRGCRHLQIFMKNGKYEDIGIFSLKEVTKLKDKYGSLITIFT